MPAPKVSTQISPVIAAKVSTQVSPVTTTTKVSNPNPSSSIKVNNPSTTVQQPQSKPSNPNLTSTVNTTKSVSQQQNFKQPDNKSSMQAHAKALEMATRVAATPNLVNLFFYKIDFLIV